MISASPEGQHREGFSLVAGESTVGWDKAGLAAAGPPFERCPARGSGGPSLAPRACPTLRFKKHLFSRAQILHGVAQRGDTTPRVIPRPVRVTHVRQRVTPLQGCRSPLHSPPQGCGGLRPGLFASVPFRAHNTPPHSVCTDRDRWHVTRREPPSLFQNTAPRGSALGAASLAVHTLPDGSFFFRGPPKGS